MNNLTFYLLLAPVIAVATCLFIYWLTDLQDRRDERQRHHAAE